MVLRHQVTLHNSLTDANHRARIELDHWSKRREQIQQSSAPEELEETLQKGQAEVDFLLNEIAEQLVDGILMVDDVAFSEPITGTSSFAEDFVAAGMNSTKEPSLRTLNLNASLFEYPCSYLIESESFRDLPAEVLKPIQQRLQDVLLNQDKRPKYDHLDSSKRGTIHKILLRNGVLPALAEATAGD